MQRQTTLYRQALDGQTIPRQTISRQTISLQTVQRLSLNPLDWATSLLRQVTGDAETDEAAAQNDATAKAGELESQSSTRSTELQGESQSQQGALAGEEQTQASQINQHAETQATGIQSQAAARATQLNGSSASEAAGVQQAGSSTSARLNTDVRGLDNQTRSTSAAATQRLGTDVNGTQTETDATAQQVRTHWTAVESGSSSRVTGLTGQTQALVDQKTALVEAYQAPGAHDPEAFQKRWLGLQQQVKRAEGQESRLHAAEQEGSAASGQAETVWSRLSGRGQALLGRAESLAAGALSGFQSRWAGLQGMAAQALGGVRERATAAVASLKSLATSAWTGLQNLATQAATRAKELATTAWNGLKSRVTAAWTGLQSRATAAWNGLRSGAGSAVSALTSRISGIVSRINGALGRILDLLASAVSSLISRVRDVTGRALAFLQSKAEAAWNALRNLGSRAWEGLKDWGTGAWERLKELGTRAWERLKDLGGRVWNGLKELGQRLWSGLQKIVSRIWDSLNRLWDSLKKAMSAAWEWLKRAWDAVKRAAGRMWEWLKRQAKQFLDWLKRRWEWLKGLIRKALDWLKAKWKWLKSLVKITIRIPDQTLCKLKRFKPWKFSDIHSGRIPIAKVIVDPGIGPVELALFVQADAVANLAGTIGPCTLKNIFFTLQPLISRYTAQADLHVAGTAAVTQTLTGTIGGTANYGGLIALVGGGLEGTGSSTALASLAIRPRVVYDSGKIIASVPVTLDFCLLARFDIGAFVTAKLIAGKPPAPPPAPAPSPIGPGPIPSPGPIFGPGLPSLSGPGTVPGASSGPSGPSGSPRARGKPPDEKILKEWIARWNLKTFTKKECWKVGVRFTVVSGPGGLPDLDVEFSARPESLGDVLPKVFEPPPTTSGGGGSGGGGSGGGAGTLKKEVTSLGRCKCIGDPSCSRIYEVCFKTQKDCKKAQKDLEKVCNGPEIAELCQRPKCRIKHSDPDCPADCEPGTIRPLESDVPGLGHGGAHAAGGTAYRNGNRNARNLVPRIVDTTGLSCTETKPPKGWAFTGGKSSISGQGFEIEDDPTDVDPLHFLVRPGPEHIAQGLTMASWQATKDTTKEEDPTTWHELTKRLRSIAS